MSGDALFEKLDEVLRLALRKLELYFSFKADDDMLKRLFGEVIHIFIHEAAHAFVRATVPWLDRLSDVEREFLDEVFSRLVERAVSQELREELRLDEIVVESPEEQLMELEFYPRLRGLRLSIDEYSELYEGLRERLKRGEPAERVARWLLEIGRGLMRKSSDRQG